MQMVEKEAQKLGIEWLQLGTTSFQARAFYERLGFHVIHTMHDYPKGFDIYTLIKKVK
jgi:ribosomal protein S18 acetylase RimI-like enzyme